MFSAPTVQVGEPKGSPESVQRGSLRKPSAGWTGDSAPGSPAYPSRHPHFYPVPPPGAGARGVRACACVRGG